MKLLVVEDELYARQALIRQIQKYDREGMFELLESANGEDGWELCQRENPEVVLTDIRMPKMDGLKLLEAIRREGKKTKVIILSAYSDFDYARSALANGAFDYLLKPIEDGMLFACLDRLMEQQKSERKEALLLGRDMVTQYILNSIRKANYAGFVEKNMFSRTFPSYQIGLICLRGILEKHTDWQEQLLCEMEREYGSASLTKLRLTELEADLWVLLIRPEGDTLFLWRRIQKLLLQFGADAKIGVSAVYTAKTPINAAYKETADLLKSGLNSGDTLLFADRDAVEWKDYYLPKTLEQLLGAALEQGDGKKALGVLDEIFDGVRKAKPVRGECLELLYSQIMILCRRAIRLEETGTELEKRSEKLFQFDCLDDLKDYLKRIAGSICQMQKLSAAEGASMPSGSEIVSRMTAYAMEHYSMDITVRELAENVFFMNQNYISHLFAEKKGISFSAFLRKIRIDHAKKLLEEEKWSVTEVASMVGYNDTSQFIRIFRQETGVTPKKYRTQKQEEALE